jgi:acetylornithine/succinyldiaminopimelate/putrescine aminotransferase
LVAVTLESGEMRNALLRSLFDHEMMALPSGPEAIRFRLPYVIAPHEVDEMLNRVAASVPR